MSSEPGTSTNTTVNRVRISLHLKFIALVVAVLVFSTVALGTSAFYVARGILYRQIDSRLSVIAKDRQKLLLAYIKQQHERVALVASRTRFRQLTHLFLNGELTADEFVPQSQKILLDALSSTEGFHAIWLADPDGRVITATDKTYLERDYAKNADFQAGRNGKYLGQPFLSNDVWQAFATAPATASDGTSLGVVMVLLDVTPMVEFLSDATSLGETGEVMVGTRHDDRIRYLLPPRHDSSVKEQFLDDASTMFAAIQGDAAFVESTDYRGQDVLVAYSPVGYDNWGMVAKMDVAEAYAPVKRLARFSTGIAVAVLLPGLLASYWLARLLTLRILVLTDSAAAVAAGDLDAKLETDLHANDELGDLATAFERMKAKLSQQRDELQCSVDDERANRRAVEQLSENLKQALEAEQESRQHIERLLATIRQASLQLLTSTSEILSSMSGQAAYAQQQGAALAETSVTVAEITETAEQAADRAKQVADLAQRADAASQAGRAAVSSSIDAMDDVRGQVETTAENILSLAQQAAAIGEIISVVTDIAEQTNVLALNAAVEASRAGEHGKGFAVVASEVKLLADQSKKATLQIRQILGEIQKATNTAVLSTERGTNAVSQATGIIRQADTTIETLVESMSSASRAASQILASANQQAAAMSQIHQAMNSTRHASEQSLSATRETEEAAKHLMALGDRLRELIESSEQLVQ